MKVLKRLRVSGCTRWVAVVPSVLPTNQPTFALLAGSRKVVVFSGCTRWVAVVANVLPTRPTNLSFSRKSIPLQKIKKKLVFPPV